jgi:hypothetical protein
MSENLWRPRLESYLAVREAMGHSVPSGAQVAW